MQSHSLAVIFMALVMSVMPSTAEAQIRHFGEMSVADIRALDRSKTVVLIPGGLFEEHGPYLPVMTDGYANEWVAMRVAEAIVTRPGWQVVLFPQIPLGVGSPEDFGARSPFSGSYTVRPSTLRAVLMDLATALGDDGFRWIFVVHQHGSPSHNRMLLAAADYFNDSFDGGKMAVLTSLEYTRVDTTSLPAIWSQAEKKENAGDVHAGAGETSSMLFVRPQFVHEDYQRAVPQTASNPDDLLRLARQPEWPGYFGSPRLARADIGAVQLRRGADTLAELAVRILDGFDFTSLPRRGDLTRGSSAFVELDRNLQSRVARIEKRQNEWLSRKGLQ